MVQIAGDNYVRECPACGSEVRVQLGQKSTFELLSCSSCGTVYTATLPRTQAIKEYSNYYDAENLLVPKFIQQRLGEIVSGFECYRERNRLLEVGFGAGSLLEAAVADGWDVEGVEVSESAVVHAREAGYKTFWGELQDARYADSSFDVVVASELLEHLPAPATMVGEVARILRPGGLFWATTPNAKGLSSRMLDLDWSVICPPEHLQLFSETGLKIMVRRVGFRNVNVFTEGTNPFELMNRFRGRKKLNEDVSLGKTRVKSSYRLNEALTKSNSRKAFKNFGNGLLRVSQLGDSLKIYAMR